MTPMQDPDGSAPTGKQRKFLARPSTRLGRWSVALAAVFAALFIIYAAVFMRLPEAPWQPIVGPSTASRCCCAGGCRRHSRDRGGAAGRAFVARVSAAAAGLLRALSRGG